METTFITIHNLLPDANILFASESIFEILGYNPDEVIGRSCFEYFHPDEVPFARNIHNRGVLLDKAAVLHYARIRGRDGQWVGCECVFTVVYEVLVASTSIYREDEKNERRALEAPAIRRIFASSPQDPRYHMLEHLSPKFKTPPRASLLEPRAALILNRFTRHLTVMYATEAVFGILGVSVDQITGKSFYECIRESCLPDAVRCLESAKANDSIAYLRFWYRDPRREEDMIDGDSTNESQSSDSDEDGGVQLADPMDIDEDVNFHTRTPEVHIKVEDTSSGQVSHESLTGEPSLSNSRTSSGQTSDMEQDASRAMFDQSTAGRSSSSSMAPSSVREDESIELEAIVSCTSDGLVVVLRRARPRIPNPYFSAPRGLGDGLFAAPWGANPIRPHPAPLHNGQAFPAGQVAGPPQDEFLASIREVAVFAWSLIGINGNIADYGHGIPRGQAQPATGLPIWDPYAIPAPKYQGPHNQAAERWARMGEQNQQPIVVEPQQRQEAKHLQISDEENQESIEASQQTQLPLMEASDHHGFPDGVPQSDLDQGAQTSNSESTSRSDTSLPGYSPSGPGEGSSANRYLWF